MTSEEQIEKEYHVSWYIIAHKLLFGVVEAAFGLGISLLGKTAFRTYQSFVEAELSEDPHDVVVRITREIIPNLLTHNTTLAIYLIILGIAKIAGAIGLLYHRNWGVDLLVGLTVLMFPFQFIRLLMHPSLPDFLYITIGIFIALYLVDFKPNEWASRVKERVVH